MRHFSMPLLAALVAGPAPAADTHPFSVHDMLAMDRISDPRVSPDGASVAFTVRVTDLDGNRGRNDIWIAPTAGGAARRLTTHEASDTQARWAPDGRSLFFVSTRTGSAQVFRVGLAGGEPEGVTRLPLDVDALEVAPGGRHLLLAMAVFPGKTPAETAAAVEAQAKRKASGRLYDRLFVRHWDTWDNGTRNHLFSYELAGGKVTDLMAPMDADAPAKPFGGSEEYSVTPDGRTVVFTAKDVGREEAWSTNFDLYAAPIDGSAPPRKLTANPATDTQPRFSPDGKVLAYLAMSRPGFEADRFRIVLRDWATGTERSIDLRADASESGDRSPDDIRWSLDGQEIYATADHLGQHPLFAIDPAKGAARILVGDGHVTSPQPMPAGKVLYGRDSLLGPSELHVVHRVARKAPIKITGLNDEKVARARFGKPEPFTFTGSHNATVHGWITHPVDFDPAKRYPVAFLIHGGPQGSFGNDFHYRWNPQAYAGAGYAAVTVDFTGSTGYGQAFTDRIRNDWGGAPYEDLMKGLDHVLGRYSFLDRERVCALGASYGGYMVNWIAGKTDRFKCLVSHDGNLDEHSAYYMTEELWFPEWEHGGPAYENPEGYTKHSPMNLVKNWKTPMLVVHGEKDYRVVYTQGLATFTALQRKGIPSKLLILPDENHWVLKPQNSILWHETVLGWLDQWGGKSARAAEAPIVPTLAIGAAAPDFDLPGVDGRRHSLKDFASFPVLVLVFTCNHCPTAQAYEERIQKLHDDYSGKGVALVAISPNDPKAVRLDELGYSDLGDSLEDMKIRAEDKRFTFPYLYDGDTQATSREYGPVATPHVFVFDRARKLRFAGRVDDAENPEKIKVRDTRNAIDALLKGEPVPVDKTKVFGCSIKWADKKGWVAEGVKKWAEEEVTVSPIDEAGLATLAKNESTKLRLINAWATWCGPCVVEFPELVTIHRMYRGRAFEVVTVSADPAPLRADVLKFLKDKQASTRNYLAEDTEERDAMINALDPEWQGELPHTMLVAPGGRVIYRTRGAFEPLALKKAIIAYLGRYYHSVAGK